MSLGKWFLFFHRIAVSSSSWSNSPRIFFFNCVTTKIHLNIKNHYPNYSVAHSRRHESSISVCSQCSCWYSWTDGILNKYTGYTRQNTSAPLNKPLSFVFIQLCEMIFCYSAIFCLQLTLNLLAPTTVGARINP